MRTWLLCVVALLLALSGCGGGGGGGATSILLTGTVANLATGGAPSPAATVASGSVTGTTGTDGGFSLSVPPGATFVDVTFNPGSGPLTFRFNFSAASDDTDLGVLVVGPQQITVTGLVLNQNTSAPVSGATVRLAGNTTTTDANGRYTFNGVAYVNANPATFYGLEGRAGATNFFPRLFSPTNDPVAGVATLEDVLLAPDAGGPPPGTPFNIEGLVNPSADGVSAVVELRQGATVVRRMTTGSDRRFGFWVAPGTYTLVATKGTLASPPATVNLPGPADTVRRDVTLQ